MAKIRILEFREFFKAVVEKAEAMCIPVAMAVVNAEGHLLALERMVLENVTAKVRAPLGSPTRSKVMGTTGKSQ